MGFFDTVVDVFTDSNKAIFQVGVSAYNVITGDHKTSITYNTGIGKLVGKIQGDATKKSLQPAVKGVDSVTGYNTDLQFQTGTGKFLGNVSGTISDYTHSYLKGFANSVSGGLATKLTNSWRDPKNREGDGTALFGKKASQDSLVSEYSAVSPTLPDLKKKSSQASIGNVIGLLLFLLLFFGLIFINHNKKK